MSETLLGIKRMVRGILTEWLVELDLDAGREDNLGEIIEALGSECTGGPGVEVGDDGACTALFC